MDLIAGGCPILSSRSLKFVRRSKIIRGYQWSDEIQEEPSKIFLKTLNCLCGISVAVSLRGIHNIKLIMGDLYQCNLPSFLTSIKILKYQVILSIPLQGMRESQCMTLEGEYNVRNKCV